MSQHNDDIPQLPGIDLDATFGGASITRFRNAIIRHLELIFVLIIAFLVLILFFFIPYKFAFLNLFYLPVLLAAYFLGKNKSLLASLHIILLVAVTALIRPEWFTSPGVVLSTMVMITIWGGFLVLTSIIIGSLQERVSKGFAETRRLYEELKRSRVIEEMKEKVEKTLYTTMDPVVAKLATEGKLRIEKREITIMFCDLTDFTTYSDQNAPDIVLDELNRFIGLIEPVIDLYRGHIDKYMGDGVMVEFGAPIDYAQHAVMSVLAAIKIQERLKDTAIPWRLRIGIATGNAIVGMMGVNRQAYSAIGDKVNVAKRLEEICEPDKIYIDEVTYRMVEPFINVVKVRNMSYSRQSDKDLLEQLRVFEGRMVEEGESADLLYRMGKVHFGLHDVTAAISCFEHALIMDPDSTEIRLAYADANLKKDEYEKIQLKGKLHKISVFEVKGVKSRWHDPNIIPPSLVAKYRDVEAGIKAPFDAVLAVESLDGSIGRGLLTGMLSYAIADQLRLNEDLKQTILQAGLLQDMGKEAVPHHILNRPASLTEQEIKLIEKYVIESVAILKRLGYVDETLLNIVKHHHELWNGNGYPDGLVGEAIPIGSRITAIAEVYCAMTSWRPYRGSWDVRLAVNELRKNTEKGYYDPEVAEALFEILKHDTTG
ncbi:MAG: adenylate/guanylate cyclase domain-containing protein [Syntrophorhabdaceae bacterium]|nr:adenylate/guanylate cyclase domain-containing protein [Syntrophorhabdaceae bacterium]MDD5243829.1 adenylate/guanylate cyclase domain-containing protein [Syntrophorhabdaceae bacterium]